MFLEKPGCKQLWRLILEGKLSVTISFKAVLRGVESLPCLGLGFRFCVFATVARRDAKLPRCQG